MRKKNPNITKNATVMTPLPMLNRRSRNSQRGSIGWSLRRSQATNEASTTPATRNAATTRLLVQPSSGPWMMAKIRELSPTSDSTAPTGSRGVWVSSRELGANAATAATMASTTGTLTSRVEPHQKPSSSPPVTMGPIEAPAPANPAQTAMARGRSSGGKIDVMSDSVAGMMNAAPMPITARLAISWEALPASPPSREPRPNTARPPSSAPRRPKRSPMAPALSSRPANRTA